MKGCNDKGHAGVYSCNDEGQGCIHVVMQVRGVCMQ